MRIALIATTFTAVASVVYSAHARNSARAATSMMTSSDQSLREAIGMGDGTPANPRVAASGSQAGVLRAAWAVLKIGFDPCSGSFFARCLLLSLASR